MAKMPPHRRAEILEGLAAQMKDRHDELSLTIAQEGGKPLKDARIEVIRAINTVQLSAAETTQLDGEQQAMGGSLFTFDEIDEAVDAANAGPNGFQAALFTRDIDTAFRVDWMPFGGRHHSGLGMGGVKYSIHEMTQPKLIVLNL
jgi:acyl-CoA reductase-like NAD-dependent aldehyde dehydrogenase